MSNAPMLEQIEQVISDSTYVSYGPDGGTETISPFTAATKVQELYAPVLAELEQVRAEVERLKDEPRDTRRTTLLEIASAFCPFCKRGEPAHKEGRTYYHGIGWHLLLCRAPDIQAMLEKTKAPEVPNA